MGGKALRQRSMVKRQVTSKVKPPLYDLAQAFAERKQSSFDRPFKCQLSETILALDAMH